MAREDLFKVTAKMTKSDNTIVDMGSWDGFEGGEVDSEEAKYTPGDNQGREVSLGGKRTVGNFTIKKIIGRTSSDHADMKTWQDNVGKATVTVIKQPLDATFTAFGSASTYSGILKTVTPPNFDSNSSDAAIVELEISSNGTVS